MRIKLGVKSEISGGKKSTLWKMYEGKEKFCFYISFEFQCYAYLSTCAVEKKKKKEREKRNERKKNKKKNIVHTLSIGKNVMLHVLFYFVTLIRE